MFQRILELHFSIDYRDVFSIILVGKIACSDKATRLKRWSIYILFMDPGSESGMTRYFKGRGIKCDLPNFYRTFCRIIDHKISCIFRAFAEL